MGQFLNTINSTNARTFSGIKFTSTLIDEGLAAINAQNRKFSVFLGPGDVTNFLETTTSLKLYRFILSDRTGCIRSWFQLLDPNPFERFPRTLSVYFNERAKWALGRS